MISLAGCGLCNAPIRQAALPNPSSVSIDSPLMSRAPGSRPPRYYLSLFRFLPGRSRCYNPARLLLLFSRGCQCCCRLRTPLFAIVAQKKLTAPSAIDTFY